MALAEPSESDKTVETWETTGEGTVWVWVYDKREDRYVSQRVGGRAGSRRLRIRRDDRKYNQEQVVEENKQHDPFTNGMLRLVEGGDETVNTQYHWTLDDYQQLLNLKDEDTFKSEVEEIDSELIIRRLKEVAEKHGQLWQVDFLRDLIEERYRVGGTQKTVQQMIDAGENLGIQLY